MEDPHRGKMIVVTGASAGTLALYQMGILKTIPEPRLPGFNTGKVTSSPEAYSRLATPDALLGLVNYGATACLADGGAQNRWQTHPWIPLCMAGKIAMDVAPASKLAVDEWTKNRAFCFLVSSDGSSHLCGASPRDS